MNWQAEFLDNPEIRLTFDHFPFFQKQGIMENRFSFDYQHYDSPEGMPAGDRELVEEARRAVARAYAPYSKFRVGAADDPIEALAIASEPSERECYPCGQCRQVLLDAERRQGSPIRIIMSGAGGATVVDSAVRLLPFTFQL